MPAAPQDIPAVYPPGTFISIPGMGTPSGVPQPPSHRGPGYAPGPGTPSNPSPRRPVNPGWGPWPSRPGSGGGGGTPRPPRGGGGPPFPGDYTGLPGRGGYAPGYYPGAYSGPFSSAMERQGREMAKQAAKYARQAARAARKRLKKLRAAISRAAARGLPADATMGDWAMASADAWRATQAAAASTAERAQLLGEIGARASLRAQVPTWGAPNPAVPGLNLPQNTPAYNESVYPVTTPGTGAATATRPSGGVAGGVAGDVGLPTGTQRLPRVATPGINPAVSPATIPRYDPTEYLNAAVQQLIAPRPATLVRPAGQPRPPTAPRPRGPTVTPRPPIIAPPTSPGVSVPSSPLTPFQAPGVGFAPNLGNYVTPRPDRTTETDQDKCDRKGPKRERGKCAQGYYRQFPDGTTQYTKWSTRKCR